MHPKYNLRSDFVFKSDSDDSKLNPDWESQGFNIHIVLPNGGNRPASKGEILGVCENESDAKLAIYPQSAGMDAVDVDKGGYEGVKAVLGALSSYTPLDFLVTPSKTPGRYHVYIPVSGPRSALEGNTSPKWAIEGNGGEIKGGTSRITLHQPVSTLNWLTEMAGKDERIDPQIVRRELCEIKQSSGDSKSGNYRKFIKRDLSNHDNVLSAFLAVFEAGKKGELESEKVESLAQEITDKAISEGRANAEIERARKSAANFVENQTGQETAEIGSETRSVRAPDIDMAGFITAKFGDLIRYIEESGKYVTWSTKAKRITRDKGASWEFADILSDISKTITARYGTDDKERLYYGSAVRAKAVESLLRGQIDCKISDFDSDKFLMGAPGFDINLRNSKMDESSPKNKIMKRAAILPDKKIHTPVWNKFVLETFGEGIAPYMLRYLGYCLTGTMRESKVLFLVGLGGSGKTTFTNVARNIMGNYATSIAKKVLFPGKHSSDMHLTFIAQLQGKRLAIVPETDSYDKMNESLFKSLSGNDEITANFMRRDPFTFTNTAKLIVLSNFKPRLSSFDSAIRRRLVIVPCDHEPPEIDLTLEDKLMAESPGIFAKLLDECAMYCSCGLLPMPDVVETVTDEHLDSQDLFGCFIRDRYEYCDGAKMASSAILADYRVYLQESNEQWLSQHYTLRQMCDDLRRYADEGVSGPKVIRIGDRTCKGYVGLKPRAGPIDAPL